MEKISLSIHEEQVGSSCIHVIFYISGIRMVMIVKTWNWGLAPRVGIVVGGENIRSSGNDVGVKWILTKDLKGNLLAKSSN